MKAFGIVTGGHNQGCSGVGTDAEEAEKLWNRLHEKRFDPLIEFGELIVESTDAVRQ